MEIIFILVKPAVPENIGATARALKTMGFSKLRLVNPAGLYSSKVNIVAHGSNDIIRKAEVFYSFEEAVKDLDFIVATSAKKRRTNEDYIHAGNLKSFLREKDLHVSTTGIVFGSEESGLDNELIKRCDLITYIPLQAPYPSLNLSHAVMIFAYLLSGIRESPAREEAIIPEENLQALKRKVSNILENIEIKQPHIIGPRIFERLSYLKNQDINLLHSICNAYLEKYKS